MDGWRGIKRFRRLNNIFFLLFLLFLPLSIIFSRIRNIFFIQFFILFFSTFFLSKDYFLFTSKTHWDNRHKEWRNSLIHLRCLSNVCIERDYSIVTTELKRIITIMSLGTIILIYWKEGRRRWSKYLGCLPLHIINLSAVICKFFILFFLHSLSRKEIDEFLMKINELK